MSMSGEAQKKPIQLPLLRRGITFAFNDYDTEGKPQWLIHDAGRNKFFLIGWLEYEILSRWALSDPDKIIDSIHKETTLNVDMTDIENFFKFLANHFLLEQSGYKIYQQAKEQNLFKKDNFLHLLTMYYLFFRIPLVHPDHFLDKTKWFSNILFHRYTAYLMIALAFIALWQLSERWETFIHTFSTLFTLQGLFFYLIAFLSCKLFHELGHAYMCKRFGVPVPTLGVAFLVFWPVLYTDTTLSWSLDSRKRMRIALAGIWAETYITIIAALLWCNVHQFTLQSICYTIITVNWVGSLLINVSPFMRFDGYYVLADFLRMPNLQGRAFELTRWQIRKWLFNWPDPVPEKFSLRMHYFLIVYSIMTWLYRLIIYLGIAILVYHFFVKIIGIILFIIEIFYFILAPIVREISFWIKNREKFSLNTRTLITTSLLILFLIFFLLPFNQSVRLPATISYAHEFIYAPDAGILLTKLPATGTSVKAGTILTTISSPDLAMAMNISVLNYQKTLRELRRASVNPQYSDQKTILISQANKNRSEYSRLAERYKKLTIKAPFDGIVVDSAIDLLPGVMVKKNEWLGDLIAQNDIRAEAFVTQIDISRIKPGLRGTFYPKNLEQPAVPVTVKTIEVINTKQLNCNFSSSLKQDIKQSQVVETACYQISDLGGEIPTLINESGNYVPANSVYRVILNTSTKTKPTYIENGTVILDTEPRSFIYQLLYQLKKIWIEQSGF